MRIAVLDDYQRAAASAVDWAGGLPGHELFFLHEHLEGEALVDALRDVEAVVAMRERTAFPEPLLERLPRLRLLVTTGMRNAAIDVAAATRAGITVCGTGGYTHSAAELTWGLLLAVARSLTVEDADVRAGGWQRTVGLDLAGKTLAVVGLGRVGARVAGYGTAFGMRVVAWSPHLTPERAGEHGVELVSREEAFASADALSLHLVLGRTTRGLIGESDLRRMKRSSILVNTARGPIIQEEALVRALREGWIAGAGLDVFDTEPLPAGHVLRSLPRTVLTPHLGYVTRDTYAAFFSEAVEDIQSFLAGTPLRRLER